MKIFLSAVEASPDKKCAVSSVIDERKAADLDPPLLWNLMSYYALRSDVKFAEKIRDCSRLVLIDSGAHSFQKGKKVKWEDYTREYAAFIREFDRANVVGYFEMDVDNIIGYERVLDLRKILERESGVPEKIIPVWHKNRGIRDFESMCREHAGRVIAIPGFRADEIKNEQFAMFVKKAREYDCKVHCLGMTRAEVLNKVPFDYVDSSSWAQSAIHGRVGKNHVSREFSKTSRTKVFIACYKEAQKMQVRYFQKWQKVAGDEF